MRPPFSKSPLLLHHRALLEVRVHKASRIGCLRRGGFPVQIASHGLVGGEIQTTVPFQGHPGLGRDTALVCTRERGRCITTAQARLSGSPGREHNDIRGVPESSIRINGSQDGCMEPSLVWQC